MNKSNKLLLALVGLIGLAIFSYQDNQPTKNKESSKELSKQEASQERYLHDYYMTRDPKTNQVETNRLVKARSIAQKRLKSQSYEKSAIPGVSWEERGPTNVSGRTRTILIDKSDASGNTVFSGGVAGGLWKTTDGGDNWTPIDDFFANMAVTAIAQDPNNHNIIYFGTGEGWGNFDAVRGLGIWKSTDGGDTFSQLSSTDDNFHFDYVNKIVILDSGGSSYIFAATRSRFCNWGGIMRSLNGGSSWARISEGNGVDCNTNPTANDFAADIEIASNGDLYASFGYASDTLFSPPTPPEVDGIYRSQSSTGATWEKIYQSAANEGRIELAIAPSDEDVVYAAIENYDNGGTPKLIKTTNATDILMNINWSNMGAISWVGDDGSCSVGQADWTRGQDWYDLILGVDPNDADDIYLGGVDLFKSTNGGDNWNLISSWWGGCGQYVHADQHAIAFENSNEIWFGNDGGLYKTENGSASTPTISFKSNGFNITQFYAADLHPSTGSNVMLAGAQDNGTQRFTSSGLNSTTMVTGGDGGFCHIDQTNGATQISSFVFNNYWITENNWGTNTEVNGGNFGRFINPTDYDDNANILYGSDDPNYYSRVTVSGKTYEYIYVPDFPGANDGTASPFLYSASAVKASPNISNRVYFGFNNGTVYYVNNANTGVSTSSKSATLLFDEALTEGIYVSCIEIEEGNEDHMLITLSNYGTTSVYESTNATAGSPLWTAVEGDLPDMPVRWASFNPTNPDQAFLATELGVWSTTNLNGTSTQWMPTNAGLANTRIDMVKFRSSDNQMVAASHGRGLFTASINEMNDCDDQLLTLSSFTNNTTYDDAFVIESASTMDKNNVTFRAESAVELKEGFSVADNKVFTAEIGDCPE